MPWCCPLASSFIAARQPAVGTYKKRKGRFLNGLADGSRLAGLFAYKRIADKAKLSEAEYCLIYSRLLIPRPGI